ncbi:head maturation protease, ClpP-related [Parendozoicomonas sp. Alg238-R29]|uniref:head maturation protease, ClpP-related n=1 Tax=Parendozoicomonas sp. Alg238-R29 TaxID=2993446 RepID=UPI00248E1642|nr:head maturation protease, ClpP-related [Parendozoicomonas sp. Alg238-R29]
MKWYNLKHKASEKRVVVNIHEQIGKNWWDGSGVTAKGFIDEMEAVDGEITDIEMHINSPGGNVYDGVAIYNYLKRHAAKVTVYIDGEASSIASVIAMAGDEIIMPENGLVMIHDPMAGVCGYLNAPELRDMADKLDVVKNGILSAYRAKTGKDDDELWALLEAETYMDATQAHELGFVDTIEKPLDAVAHSDMKTLLAGAKAEGEVVALKARQKAQMDAVQAKADLAEQKLKELQGGGVTNATSIITACNEAGMDFLAAGMVSRELTIEDANKELTVAKSLGDALTAANLSDSIQAVVNEMHSPLKMVQRILTDMKAQHDAEIDGSLSNHTPDAGEGKTVNRTSVYDQLNNTKTPQVQQN